MARQLRIIYPNALYYITSCGNTQQDIFFNDSDRRKFLSILARTKEEYGYILHSYCLMNSCFHLLLETPHANLHAIMQNINTSYTVYVNRKYKRTGHLFRGRYKAIIVDKENYLLRVSKYIHLKPVEARLTNLPGDYMWSSYKDFIHPCNSIVDTEFILSRLCDDAKKSRELYKYFVEKEKSEDIQKNVKGVVLGDERFIEDILQRIKNIRKKEHPVVRQLMTVFPPMEVIAKVAAFFGVKPAKILRRSRNRWERKIAIYLAKVLSRKSHRILGRYFGISGAAISAAIKKCMTEMKKDKKLEKIVEQIKNNVVEEKTNAPDRI
ncbi:MAG: transposase [Deltaproteobacteria bacterium]|nr:transposase [Deltaproteobacteria bacterium]